MQAIIQNKESQPLPQLFYDEVQRNGITILADVSPVNVFVYSGSLQNLTH